MTNADDELVDVLNGRNQVVRTATRAEVRAGNLRHRTVFIAVVDEARQLLVHQRARWKDVWPSYWDVAFGGVVDAGEGSLRAAVRELDEEAGIDAGAGWNTLESLGAGTYEDDLVDEHAEIYLIRHPGPFAGRDGEVQQVRWVALANLDRWLRGVRCVPDSLALVVPRLRSRFDLHGRD